MLTPALAEARGEKDYNGLQDFDFSLKHQSMEFVLNSSSNMLLKNPKVIMITGWNEVCGRSEDRTSSRPQDTPDSGYYLVDQFNPEFSRDGEPMKLPYWSWI